MTTKALLKTPLAAAVTRPAPRSRPGRPRRTDLVLRVMDPHDPARVLSIPAARVATWCGVSRQTAARWCRHPAAVPVAAWRLLALYAHGRPPIPPDCLNQDGAAGWLQFAFYFERDPAWSRTPGGRWLLAIPGQRPANWCQVHALFTTLPTHARLLQDWRAHAARTAAAEAEAARLRDLVAYQ